MLRKVLPILLALIGLGAGVAAGLVLRPAPDQSPAADGSSSEDSQHSEGDAHKASEPQEGAPEYVKMNNQFVVPVVKDGRVASMIVLSLSLEVAAGNTEAVYQREPKLRDAFLRVLFDHANVGGFSGSFTDGANLLVLRTNLKEAAALVLGPVVSDVLITDIARQDG
ncbi:flagellar basal body-associated FliL family protein [Tabrizicola thermarum]|uniref:flagellar basal body-associated FliL family protein n=1 Tax=Tabrizicola thermarum TaxID=2670345 RepID=UPI000FFB17EB|nr:flagellar basal body-associated FliL family protein [Tabrizicola thermarum]